MNKDLVQKAHAEFCAMHPQHKFDLAARDVGDSLKQFALFLIEHYWQDVGAWLTGMLKK